jgi:hypothetical protein
MHVPRWMIAMQAVAGVVMAGAGGTPARAQSRGSVARHDHRYRGPPHRRCAVDAAIAGS